MSATNACPECGARVPRDAPRGLCPRCLLAAMADPATASFRVEGGDRKSAEVPTIGRSEFLRGVRGLDLVADDELDRLAGIVGDDVAQLARLLVQSKKLTAYQAGALLQGKGHGLVIGSYLVVDKLGMGGMGVVFKAVHQASGRVVALKLLPPSFGRDADAIRRFRREFQVASRLSHPNLVAAIEASEDRGVHYLTMEYIPGYDLDRLVERGGPMELRLALHAVIQAARGLEAAHASGVVHRDIKPGNIMIDPAGVVRVLDLGLARVIEATSGFGMTASGPLTQTGSYMGTVDFLAPEQANDAKSADGRADIYSLGCTLYYLLTGRPPFAGDTALQRLMAHQQRPAPSLRAARPEVPEALEDLHQRMMAKRPEDRPATMSEVVLLLERRRSNPREAGDVSADLKTFARTALKRAPDRRRTPDDSVFARPEPKSDDLAIGHDLDLEDLITDFRPEGGRDPIPEEKLPPIAHLHRTPKSTRRRRSSSPIGALAIGALIVAIVALWLRPRSTPDLPETATKTAIVPAPPVPPPPPSPPLAASGPLTEGKRPDSPKGRIVFADEFDNPQSGWASLRADELNWERGEYHGYKDGRYVMQAGAGQWFFWTCPATKLPKEFTVEIVGRLVGPDVGGWRGRHGIFVGYEGERWVQTGIDPNGRTMSLLTTDDKDPAQKRQFGPFEAPSSWIGGGRMYRLTAQVKRGRFTVLVDGEPVGEPVDVPWDAPATNIMLGVSGNEGTTRAEIERFEIRELDPSAR